tara:strand:- start:3199 stop:3582 length:384 start_codon:yes stop_codon:yes gene_type:complete
MKQKITLSETVEWLKANVDPIEGFAAAKLKGQKAGVNVYGRAWGTAFGSPSSKKKAPAKKPAKKKPAKAPAKKVYGKRKAAASKVKAPATSFTVVIESAQGRIVTHVPDAHVELDPANNRLTVSQSS